MFLQYSIEIGEEENISLKLEAGVGSKWESKMNQLVKIELGPSN